MFGFDDDVARFANRRRIRQSNNFGTRCHHFAHARVAEFNRRLDQLAFFFFDDAFSLADIDQRLDVIAIAIIFFIRRRFLQLFFLK